jgi:spore maturation protein SpmB
MNPYESPSAAVTTEEQSHARARLLPVALGLLIPSILHITGGLFYFAYVFHTSAPNAPDPTLVAYCMYYGVSMFYCLLLVSGAFSIMRLGSYLWAVAVCILAAVPLLGPCYVLGIPFGIWGVIVLRRPDVRAAFTRV